MNTLVFATNNDHKLKEVQALMPSGIQLISLKEVSFFDEIIEDGNTFRANALIKAKAVFEKTKHAVFSDDSGLVVEALDGAPGIDSAHYSGGRNSEDNYLLLLKNMEGQKNRSAYFYCVFCLMIDESQIHYFEGKVKGEISYSPFKGNGFGYDPIFVPDGFDISFAQMSSDQKNNMSHRAKALEKMVAFLKNKN